MAKSILELVHLDVCEPFYSPFLMGYGYCVTFIDDHSRKTWIFFVKKKDQVFLKFMEFKALVENHIGTRIKALRSDNGGEYISNVFRNLYAKEGISGELIAPHNPQQNGCLSTRTKALLKLPGLWS